MSGPSCRQCRYFNHGLTTAVGFANRKNDGECRRAPPIINEESSEFRGWRVFPAVFAEDWCGCFERLAPGESRGPREARQG